ncbi:MAG: OB-fold nucleic acid binding domain-containing protein [Solirubrobacteraceae bacterium]
MSSGESTAVAISGLRPGQQVDGVFACSRKDRLFTRSGSPYLVLELRDRSGTIAARAFNDADALAGRFERGDVVRVSGRVERFRDQPVLEVVNIARVSADPADPGTSDSSEGADPTQFLPVAYRDLDELDGFLEHLAGEVFDRGYRELLTRLLGDRELRAAWRRAPCTRGGHHAYLGGLLEHTVAVATLALDVCQLHPRLNQDLLLTAAIVHDLGRTREFVYGAEIGLSDEGRLLGHLVLGEQIVSAVAGGLDDSRRLELLHCLLCHHGAAGAPGGRFGSVEALTLYRLNALDASIKGAVDQGLGLETAPRSAAQ